MVHDNTNKQFYLLLMGNCNGIMNLFFVHDITRNETSQEALRCIPLRKVVSKRIRCFFMTGNRNRTLIHFLIDESI